MPRTEELRLRVMESFKRREELHFELPATPDPTKARTVAAAIDFEREKLRILIAVSRSC
jgi:hypothetical protein